MNPDIGPIIQLNTVLENGSNPLNIEAINTNKTAEICTDEQNEEKATENLDSDDPRKNTEIENVVKNLLKAKNEDQAPNMEDKKEKIITQYHQDDEIVDLEIDDWFIVFHWRKTLALEEMIPVDFEDL